MRKWRVVLTALICFFLLPVIASAAELEDTLKEAISSGNVNLVERYLDSGIAVDTMLDFETPTSRNCVSRDNLTLLGYAILKEQPEIVDLLINKKAATYAKQNYINYYDNYVILAINIGSSVDIVKKLHAAGYTAIKPFAYGKGYGLFFIGNLMRNAKISDEKIDNAYNSVKYLVEAGCPITEDDALQGADFYKVTRNSELCYVNPKTTKILSYLLQHGMNPYPETSHALFPTSPFATNALLRNDWQVARESLAGINPSEKGVPYLSWAAKEGDVEAIHKLLKNPSNDINYQMVDYYYFSNIGKDNLGATPLIYAIKSGNDEAISLFLNQKNIDVKLRDSKRNTAAHYLASRGKTEALQLVLSKGADIDASNSDLWTPLMCAAANGHEDTVELLLNSGAKAKLINRLGKNAAELASEAGYDSIANRLNQI